MTYSATGNKQGGDEVVGESTSNVADDLSDGQVPQAIEGCRAAVECQQQQSGKSETDDPMTYKLAEGTRSDTGITLVGYEREVGSLEPHNPER